MLVSVIITTKNEEQNVGNCLDSIKAQSFVAENMEIIVVDNNSIDKTKDIGEQPFPQPNQGKLEEPSRREVEAKVEARQEFFEQERTGQGRIQTNVIGMAGQGLGKIDHAIGKLTGKPDRPQEDVTTIGAPDRPGALPPGVVEAELRPAPATFEEAVRQAQEEK